MRPRRNPLPEDAIDRYLPGGEDALFPRGISRTTFSHLWAVLALLLAAGLLVWLVLEPVLQ